MSGILEQIMERLAALEAKVGAGQQPQHVAADPVVQHTQTQQPQFDPMTGQPLNQQPVQAQQPQFDPMTGKPIGQQANGGAPAAVTEAQVMALIEPHLENVPLKTALQGVLAAMGIARLPDARPDQYGELYQRFSGVISQFAGQQPAAQQPQSII